MAEILINQLPLMALPWIPVMPSGMGIFLTPRAATQRRAPTHTLVPVLCLLARRHQVTIFLQAPPPGAAEFYARWTASRR